MLRPLKAGNYIKIGNWSVFVLFGWRFEFGIITRWERREPFPSDATWRLWEIIKLLLSSELRESE